MYFTREDILKILKALLLLGIKDSEFKTAHLPLLEDDTITIVQNNVNRKVKVSNIIGQFNILNRQDFINVSDMYDEHYITINEAIKLLPERKRKAGLVITFQNTNGDWQIYLFEGTIDLFVNDSYWKDLFDFKYPIIDSILPDEEDLTLTYPDNSNNSFIKLKDKEYDTTNFSGMGTKIIRKNIIEITLDDGTIKRINYLSPNVFNSENTIYVIRYDFTLNEDITIPDNCILEFDGGSISGGNDYKTINNLKNILGKTNNIFYKITLSTSPKDGIIHKKWFNSLEPIDSICTICNNLDCILDFDNIKCNEFLGLIAHNVQNLYIDGSINKLWSGLYVPMNDNTTYKYSNIKIENCVGEGLRVKAEVNNATFILKDSFICNNGEKVQFYTNDTIDLSSSYTITSVNSIIGLEPNQHIWVADSTYTIESINGNDVVLVNDGIKAIPYNRKGDTIIYPKELLSVWKEGHNGFTFDISLDKANIELYNCCFCDNAHFGAFIYANPGYSENAIIENCDFSNNGYIGLGYGDVLNGRLYNSKATQNTNNGFDGRPSKNFIIDSCIALENSTDGFYLGSFKSLKQETGNINNCVSINNFRIGILYNEDNENAAINGATVSNSYIKGNRKTGLEFTGVCGSIINNHFEDNRLHILLNTGHGLKINASIIGNIFDGGNLYSELIAGYVAGGEVIFDDTNITNLTIKSSLNGYDTNVKLPIIFKGIENRELNIKTNSSINFNIEARCLLNSNNALTLKEPLLFQILENGTNVYSTMTYLSLTNGAIPTICYPSSSEISLLQLYPRYANITLDIASNNAKDVTIRVIFREKVIHTTNAIITV